jgi:hypothetical protein
VTHLVDEKTVRQFLEMFHARAARALNGIHDPERAVIQLCSMLPDGRMRTSAFSIGDAENMAKAAAVDAKNGINVFVEPRIVRPGRPGERGKAVATVVVFAFVVDRDADRKKAGHVSGSASAIIETSPGNSHHWYFLSQALPPETAKPIGETIRRASGADHATGVITQPYRLPGTVNYPDSKKAARGRVACATRILSLTDKAFSVDELAAEFPAAAQPGLRAQGLDRGPKKDGAPRRKAAKITAGPTRTTPRNSTRVKLKVARKATAKMDRSAQFQSAVNAAAKAGMPPDQLEAEMRQHPEGCAGKYISEGGDRLRAEIERSFAKAEQTKPEAPQPDSGIDGALLLDQLHAFLGRFIAYPSEGAHAAHTLWVAHTHMMESWESTPRIAFLSPEPGSGKTRALEITELLVPRPVQAINVTPAFLFRWIGAEEGLPTILFDEADSVFGPKANGNEEVRALLNAGHRRGAVAGRCIAVGQTIVPELLPAFAPVALAGLGDLPDTILSRSIIIRMRRRAPGEIVEPFRYRDHAKEGHALRDRLASWAKANSARVTVPAMPDGVTDRNADIWEPLLAVADLAGEKWAQVARVTSVTHVTQFQGEAAESLGLRLLADLRDAFGEEDQRSTGALLKALHEADESPWADIKGKPLNDRGLAIRLRRYGIKPKVVRIGVSTIRGYSKEDFADAWQRYLPPPPERA